MSWRAAAGLGLALATLALLPADRDDGETRAAAQRDAPKPLVVMLVLDEIPIDSILRPDGRIDAARFPNFAALAATSTWFPNATTVYDQTFHAVPSILDARLPKHRSATDTRSHKNSIYTLFHRLGWGVVNIESATAVCPRRVCRGAPTRRPGIFPALNGGGRPSRLQSWIRSIRPRGRPTLYFQHTLLPHDPWIYLPSGRQSRPAGRDPIRNISGPAGFHDRELTVHNHKRHMLQVGFVDRELGRLLQRLRATGQLDRAVVVVTADHGVSFELNAKDRRMVTGRNVEQIAPVPLFIKAAGQRHGRVNRSLVRSIDVLPTVANMVGGKLNWRHDGASVFGRAAQRRRSVAIVTRDFKRVLRIDSGRLQRRRQERRNERNRLFGTGFESTVRFGSPWAQVYRAGPNAQLIGQPVRSVESAAAGSARIANAGLLRSVNPFVGLLPTRLTGNLRGGVPGKRRDLAAAVDGRIVAVGRSFYLRGSRTENFSLMLPEESLHAGRNRVELIEVARGGSFYRLAAI